LATIALLAARRVIATRSAITGSSRATTIELALVGWPGIERAARLIATLATSIDAPASTATTTPATARSAISLAIAHLHSFCWLITKPVIRPGDIHGTITIAKLREPKGLAKSRRATKRRADDPIIIYRASRLTILRTTGSG
jgi:hypothetical protein